MGKFTGKTCKLITVMTLVITYFLVELIVGFFIQSLSLVADAFHMLSDFVALVIGVIAQRLTKMPRTSRNTFGWQRADVVGSLINTVSLCTLCFTIFVRAIERFIEPHMIHKPLLMVGVGSGGLVLNLISLVVLHFHGHSHVMHSRAPIMSHVDVYEVEPMGNNDAEVGTIGKQDLTITSSKDVIENKSPSFKETNKELNSNSAQHPHRSSHKTSSNLKAVFMHVFADTLGSVVVVISSLIIYFAPKDATWTTYVDPAMSMVLVLIILSTTAKLVYQNALILLQSVPKSVEYSQLKEDLEKVSGQNKLHDLHIWRLQSECIIGSVHIRFKNIEEYLINSKEIKSIFHNKGIHCTTIQAEFDEQDNRSLGSNRCVLDCGHPENNCDPTSCCPTNNPSPELCDRDISN